ncbi:MAG: hypothetical protein PWQ09_647 [Candidatus Cloacimonadota bacterium]|nr:hypothetical protein [Candidatus Cloacimonadota bacterium]
MNLNKFSAEELLYIAVFSALGLATKPIITPIVHLVSTPLLIPGGSLAGGFYMMWIVLAAVVVDKLGAALLVGVVQAIVILSLGFFGSHGAVSLLSYTVPGVMVELARLLFRNKEAVFAQAFMCSVANISGALIVTLLVMRLPLIPLIISLLAAAISGIIGGLVSYNITKKMRKFGIIEVR